jgi:hypothetical protein
LDAEQNIAQQSVVIEKIREEIKKCLKFNENEKKKTNLSESMGHSKGSPKRKDYSEYIY